MGTALAAMARRRGTHDLRLDRSQRGPAGDGAGAAQVVEWRFAAQEASAGLCPISWSGGLGDRGPNLTGPPWRWPSPADQPVVSAPLVRRGTATGRTLPGPGAARTVSRQATACMPRRRRTSGCCPVDRVGSMISVGQQPAGRGAPVDRAGRPTAALPPYLRLLAP